MHKCPNCQGVLLPVEEAYSNDYTCTRCGMDFTEDELTVDEGEDDIFDTSF